MPSHRIDTIFSGTILGCLQRGTGKLFCSISFSDRRGNRLFVVLFFQHVQQSECSLQNFKSKKKGFVQQRSVELLHSSFRVFCRGQCAECFDAVCNHNRLAGCFQQ